jgi:hypothetical protein
MKVFISTLTFFVITSSCFSQIVKGSKSFGLLLNGKLGKSQIDKERNSSIWGVSSETNYQYFITENASIGLSLGYGIDQTIEKFNPDKSTNFFSVLTRNSEEHYRFSILLSKYWFLNSKLALYFSPKLSSIYNEFTNYHYVDNPAFIVEQRKSITYGSNWNHTMDINVGISYFIRPKIALQSQITFANLNFTKNTQSLNIIPNNSSFLIGVQYYFSKGVN